MPDLNNWLGGSRGFGISAEARAQDAWRRIQDKPSSITLVRNATPLSAQTVRLEYDSTSRETAEGGAGKSSQRSLVVFGIAGHPVQADTDIRRGDRFSVNGVQYVVIDVMYTTGEVQARAEVKA